MQARLKTSHASGLRRIPLSRTHLIGIGTLLLAVVIAATTALVYVSPPGRKDVSFHTDDVASIRIGDGVRIAGMPVGKVRTIDIEAEQVRVTASIEADAFVGDRSQVEVRMLTPVGGYYVNLIPLGEHDLGDVTIPKNRVQMPYSLIQTLADATTVSDNVAPQPIRAATGNLETGLTGDRLTSLRGMLDAANTAVDIIRRQRGQVSQVLGMTEEYLSRFSGYRDELAEMIRKAAILEQTLTVYGNGFGAALTGLGEVGQRAKPFGVFYVRHRELVLDVVTRLQTAFRELSTRINPMIDDLRAVRGNMTTMLAATGKPAARTPLLATDMCIPLPGKGC